MLYASLVGNNFRPAYERQLFKSLTKNTQLRLERDPDNQYDPNAIKVMLAEDGNNPFGLYHLGHIDKQSAAALAPMLDEGTEFTASPFSFADPKRPLLLIEPVDDESA